MSTALGILEVASWSVGMLATDAMCKAGDVQIVQSELNDMMGVVVKISARDVASVRSAIEAGVKLARGCGVNVASSVIARPIDAAGSSWRGKVEFNPLIEQNVVHEPSEATMAEMKASDAIGFIETQGFTAVIEAIDTACKAANVEIVGREKLGGGYISVVLRGDVAAVKAAVEAGKSRAEQLGIGKLIAAHVIARPSASVLSLLPKA